MYAGNRDKRITKVSITPDRSNDPRNHLRAYAEVELLGLVELRSIKIYDDGVKSSPDVEFAGFKRGRGDHFFYWVKDKGLSKEIMDAVAQEYIKWKQERQNSE